MLLGFCVASGTTLFARERSLDEVRDQAQRDVEFLARRAAENIESGLATAEEGVVTLAANPALMSLFQPDVRSEEHTSELQSLMRISYAVFCLKKNKTDYKKLSKLP